MTFEQYVEYTLKHEVRFRLDGVTIYIAVCDIKLKIFKWSVFIWDKKSRVILPKYWGVAKNHWQYGVALIRFYGIGKGLKKLKLKKTIDEYGILSFIYTQ